MGRLAEGQRGPLYFQDLKQTKIPGLEPEKIKGSQVWVHVEPSQVTGLRGEGKGTMHSLSVFYNLSKG